MLAVILSVLFAARHMVLARQDEPFPVVVVVVLAVANSKPLPPPPPPPKNPSTNLQHPQTNFSTLNNKKKHINTPAYIYLYHDEHITAIEK